jgi:AcrR family transcriptional regulator
VADIAMACGVPEKTVFNYFPTKESLVLDRLEITMASRHGRGKTIGCRGVRGEALVIAHSNRRG